MTARVVAVSRKATHSVSKDNVLLISLVAGRGVDGDAHYGETVQHRSRVRQDPDQPNLRQVHLIHAELFDELRGRELAIGPGQMGENVTTRGIDLLALPRGTRLRLGDDAVVEVTGLRNPCTQLNGLREGLMHAVLDRTPDGDLVRKSGIMGIVIEGGDVKAGDPIAVDLPAKPHEPLDRV